MKRKNKLKYLTELGKIEKIDVILLIIILLYLPILLGTVNNFV